VDQVSQVQNVQWTAPVEHGVKVVPMYVNVIGQQRTLVMLKMANVFVKRDIQEIIAQKHVKMANGAPVVNINANVGVTIVTKKMESVSVHQAIWVQIVK